ncbi:hypothetical protein LTR94_035450, partial [Friedmanniomyces endolithicus]
GQECAGREDRRGCQGQAHRGRQRHSRRIEPRRRTDRHRPEARSDAGGGAEPAVAPHPGARIVPREHAGDPRRAPRTAEPARYHRRVRHLPRTGHHAAFQ